ncbi:MAG: YfiR family protein [Gammaproteobacteria bacterium]
MKKISSILSATMISFFCGIAAIQAAETATPPQQMENAQASTPTKEDAQVAREYFLKAAFLRYVVKYVEWPKDALPELSYNLCIIGDVPSFKGINSVNGKMVDNRSIIVQPVRTVEQAEKNCQILFISPSLSKQSAEIVEKLKNSKTLAFGDFDDFAKNGGDMNFFIMNNRMAIMINPPAVYQKGLKISEKMLKLVAVVPDLEGEESN